MNEDTEFKPYSGVELRNIKKFLNTERPRMYQQMVGRLLATIKLCQCCLGNCRECKGRMEECDNEVIEKKEFSPSKEPMIQCIERGRASMHYYEVYEDSEGNRYLYVGGQGTTIVMPGAKK